MSVLEVRNLVAHFFTPFGTVKAVDGLNFDIKKGQALGLAGESGCGKSTTALAIMDLLPYPGRIVEGENLLAGIGRFVLAGNRKRFYRQRQRR